MTEIIHITRKTSLLSPSTLACLSGLPTINLTSGCAHGCLYCYTRGYSVYPGEGRINLYADTLDRLRRELPRKRRMPVAVYFSPSSDLFQPVQEVLDLGYEVLKHLFENGVGAAFLTKGKIPKSHMDLFEKYPHLVRAQIGLTTIDEKLLKIFEPNAASPGIRLEQMKQLVCAGVITQARLDPILPGLTDDQETLDELLFKLSETGVRQAAAAVLFIRPAISGSLKRHISDKKMLDAVLSNFNKKYRLDMRAQNSPVIALPVELRKAIYDRLNKAAQRHGISVKVCACKNPDLSSGSCGISGDWNGLRKTPVQQSLFEDERK